MKFGPVPVEEARGKILAHNMTDPDGRRVLRKGQEVDDAVVATLRDLGQASVYVAALQADDVHEDRAAATVASVMLGPGVSAAPAHAGRVNVHADALGVLRVDADALSRLNQIEGFTVATLATHSVVRPGDRVATIKIIPYAVPWEAVARAEALAGASPIVSVRPIAPQEVGIVLVGSRGAWGNLESGLGEAIRGRVEALGCATTPPAFAPMDEVALAEVLRRQVSGGARVVVVAGETAIMDAGDLIPRGIRRAGGRVEHLGLAMDPGHLLLLADLEGIPVVGAPGCVRSPSPDGFHAVLPRLLAGEKLTRSDLQALGHGGLLSDPRKR
ncbi:MAG: molybdopterin-binding protein [Gemmatimonadota bacterium]